MVLPVSLLPQPVSARSRDRDSERLPEPARPLTHRQRRRVSDSDGAGRAERVASGTWRLTRCVYQQLLDMVKRRSRARTVLGRTLVEALSINSGQAVGDRMRNRRENVPV
jgi:hypothetical protein